MRASGSSSSLRARVRSLAKYLDIGAERASSCAAPSREPFLLAGDLCSADFFAAVPGAAFLAAAFLTAVLFAASFSARSSSPAPSALESCLIQSPGSPIRRSPPCRLPEDSPVLRRQSTGRCCLHTAFSASALQTGDAADQADEQADPQR